MYAARDGAQLVYLVPIRDALFARVHVARPARGHRDSSLLARLKEPQARHPYGKEDEEACHAWRLKDYQHKGYPDADAQGDYAHQPALARLSRPYVCDGSFHKAFIQRDPVLMVASA